MVPQRIRYEFHPNSLWFPYEFHRNPIRIPYDFHVVPIRIPWDFQFICIFTKSAIKIWSGLRPEPPGIFYCKKMQELRTITFEIAAGEARPTFQKMLRETLKYKKLKIKK